MPESPACDALRRVRVELTGAVQGVGLRPHLYRLATEAGLAGWVVNGMAGVCIEAEGPAEVVEAFVERVTTELPPAAVVTGVRKVWLDPAGYGDFEIRTSEDGGAVDIVVSPDLATCPSCLQEVRTRSDRRYGYAFTNCTACGPRFSIIRDLPYDRPSTTMERFGMCGTCREEYTDPADRRFHAQPNACPDCGPELYWTDAAGERLPGDAVRLAALALAEGRIVAAKGLGGFHLLCDATSDAAVFELRRRKARPRKPFAVMVRDVEMARELCRISRREAALLSSSASPILVLRRWPHRDGRARVARGVAPDNPTLGLLLPCTPMHHLLMEAVGRPIVATSGNRSEEPICIRSAEAVERLAGIADYFLLHDRPIERSVDDSVLMVQGRVPTPIRRSRGYAPFPLALGTNIPAILATGGHMKVAVGLGRGRAAWLGPHIGDLDAPESRHAFRRSVRDLLRLYRLEPEILAHDLHPDYPTTRWAAEEGPELQLGSVRRVAVQHHHAHLAALLTEHGRAPGADPVLGIVWDGTGYGPDGTIWGGEFLLGDAAGVHRVAHLRSFQLAGGEAAIRDPERIALAICRESGVAPPRHISDRADLPTLDAMLVRGVSCSRTTSAGRLFDGVAALLRVVERSTFEGEAAMALEFAADVREAGSFPVAMRSTVDGSIEVDWRPTVSALVHDVRRGTPVSVAAARFHNAMVAGMVTVAEHVGAAEVGLTGGCFQNSILRTRGERLLKDSGFSVLAHRLVPPNDGGLALGQIAVAAAASGPSSLPSGS